VKYHFINDKGTNRPGTNRTPNNSDHNYNWSSATTLWCRRRRRAGQLWPAAAARCGRRSSLNVNIFFNPYPSN